MTVSQFIYSTLQNLYGVKFNSSKKVDDKHCYICGGETNYIGMHTDDAISDKFTNQEFCKCQDSKSICEACAFLMKQPFIYFNPNKNKDSEMTLRNCSWIVTTDYTFPKIKLDDGNIRISELPNPEILRNFFLSEEKPKEFVVLFSTSGQKHLFFRGFMINFSRNMYEVVFEETLVYVKQNELLMLIEICESLLALGLSKNAIENLNVYLEKIPSDKIKKIIDVLNKYKDNPLFDLVLKISVNKEEKTEWNLYKTMKMSESMDSIQATPIMRQPVKSSTQSTKAETQKNSKVSQQKITGEPLKGSSKKQQESQELLFNL